MKSRITFGSAVLVLISVGFGCSVSDVQVELGDGGVGETGGARATGASAGGNASTGGSGAGGVQSTGGTSTAAGASATGGTVTATGGSSAKGGAAATGGTPATGGVTATTGGTPATGGTKATGGSVATGGIPASGGTAATGGTKATGGVVATGGTLTTGGTPATGGAVPTGGTPATGGAVPTGGTPATGGAVATGGTTSTTPCAAIELLKDPNLDDATSGWAKSTSDVIATTSTDATPLSGNQMAWLGGYNNALDTLSQTIALPTTFLGGMLSFYYTIVTNETTTSANSDRLTVAILDTSGTVLQTLKTFTSADAVSSWTKTTLPIPAMWAGQSIVLKFTGTTNGSNFTNFFIDSLSFSTLNCAPMLDYSVGCANPWGTTTPSSYLAQTFVPTASTLTAIRVALTEGGTLGPSTVQLRKVVGNSLLASFNVDVPTTTTATPYLLMPPTPLTVVPTDSYQIVLIQNAAVTAANLTYWCFQSAAIPAYSAGVAQTSTNSGTSWSNFSTLNTSTTDTSHTGTFWFQTY